MITTTVTHENPDAIWKWCRAELGDRLVGIVAYGNGDEQYTVTITVKDEAAAAMTRLFWCGQQTN